MATIHTFTGNEIIATEVPKYLNDNFSALNSVDEDIKTQLGAKAPLASPTLTGTPKAPTASEGTNTTQIATTAFVASAVKVKSVNGKTGDVVVDLPVGHIYWSVEPNVPAGRLPAFGALYNRSLYADLWAWANSVGLVKSESEWQAIASANGGNCAYYSSGDGSTTFRVPALKCWVKGANSASEVGSFLEAGLPNITGKANMAFQWDALVSSSGALQTPKSTTLPNEKKTWGNGVADPLREINIDASRSSSVYGNSDTVQPPSIVGMFLIVAFGVAHNIGEADVSNVMQAVEQVQTSVQTVDNKITGISDYIVESYRNGTEWYEVYKSGKVRQGGRNTKSTVTLLKSFADTNYSVFLTADNDNSGNNPRIAAVNKTTTTFKWYNGNWSYNGYWQAEGQGA